jgi:hypothetical protein
LPRHRALGAHPRRRARGVRGQGEQHEHGNVWYGLQGQEGHFSTQDPRAGPFKRYKTNGMGTEWHTGIVEDEVGHSGAK